MEKPIVFLSHSSSDKVPLAALKMILDERSAGSLEYFLSSDGQSIRFGRNWVVRVSDALARAKLMFVFLSPTSANSKWIHFEAGCAYSRDIQVVPVCLPGMELDRVNPPLSLLQGFNLHSAESMGNLTRTCNEVFQLKMNESFTIDDFASVFAETGEISNGFFGERCFAIDKIWVSMNIQLPEAEPFNPVERLKEIAIGAGLEFIDNGQRNKKVSKHEVELPGAVITVEFGGKTVKKDGEKSVRLYQIHCVLSPELFHLSAPILDAWRKQENFRSPFRVIVNFKREISGAAERHQLTTKLYQSGIRLLGPNTFEYCGLPFCLFGAPHWRLDYTNDHPLCDPRIQQVISRLFEVNAIWVDESPPVSDPFMAYPWRT